MPPALPWHSHRMTESVRATVYIIDDDPSVRKGFARVVRTGGLNAVAFGSSDDFFQSHYKTEDSCIVVDAKMPRSGGVDMLTRLRKESAGIPVIVVTAHDDADTRSDAEEAGAIGFFRKPVDADALLDAITWALKSKKEVNH